MACLMAHSKRKWTRPVSVTSDNPRGPRIQHAEQFAGRHTMQTAIQKQQEMAAALRMLADDIEKGRVPVPYSIGSVAYWNYHDDGSLGDGVTPADARAAMACTPGGWSKTETQSHIDYTKRYGGNVSFSITINRETVCEKVETGREWVPTVPAVQGHFVTTYEFRCNDARETGADAETELAD